MDSNYFVLLIKKETTHKSKAGKSGIIPIGSWEYAGNSAYIKPYNQFRSKEIFEDNYAIYHSEMQIVVCTNFLNIKPIFYYIDQDIILISSSLKKMIEYLQRSLTLNKQYILQKTLFNYPFSNLTLFNEISTLPANHMIRISESMMVEKRIEIERYFTDEPKKGRKVLEDLSDLFIHRAEKYIRNGDLLALTSGFDSRTLLAIAIYYKKSISTFSYGGPQSYDTVIPSEISKVLGIPYYASMLDQKYAENNFFDDALALLSSTAGYSGFQFVHSYTTFQKLSSISKRIVTGNFGSEIFRAPNSIGQMFSRSFYDITLLKESKWIPLLKSAPALRFLRSEKFMHDFDDLIQILIDYKRQNNSLNSRQLIFKYTLENTFSKFFSLQGFYANQELCEFPTPYSDKEFLIELMQTEFASYNFRINERNPVIRQRGQLFYPFVIKKTCPALLGFKTGKGYAPIDLLSLSGKLRITYSYLIRKILSNVRPETYDNFKILSGIEYNSSKLRGYFMPECDLYNTEYLQNTMDSGKYKNDIVLRDMMLNILNDLVYLRNDHAV